MRPPSMPPFSRLITLWSLRLLIVACVLENGVIQLVYSDQLSAGYNIQIGKLTSTKEAERNAVTELSNGQYQQAWWKLANAKWHDSAIRRFIDKGPLLPPEMARLVANSGKSDSWVQSGIVSAGSEQVDVLNIALQRIATANYKMNQSITGTGMIEASMWAYLFSCMDSSSCHEGYFVPIISIPKNQNAHQQQKQQNNTASDQYSYATLYLNPIDNLVVNASPSFIAKLPNATNHNYMQDDPDLSSIIFVHDAVPECADSTVVGFRSLLDASYGLVPGSACIRFSQDEQLNLLVFLGITSVNFTQFIVTDLTKFIKESLQLLTTEHWQYRQFEDCSTAMVMLGSQDSQIHTLCDQKSKICIHAHNAYRINGNAACSGIDYLRFLQYVTGLSNSCTYINHAKDHMPLDFSLVNLSWTHVSCANCKALVNFYQLEFGSFLLFSPQSNWSFTEGHNTSEFSQAPNYTPGLRTCIRNLTSSSASEAAFSDAIQIRARANLNSFIAEHNLAFTTAQGPATEVENFLALLVSTAISVILGISGSFTNFLLRKTCRWRPLHLDSRRSGVHKLVQVLFQIMCNVLLSFCLFLPVLYLAWSELKREVRFNTWNLGSEDQYIYSPIEDIQLRVVYLLSATSQYRSHFINVSVSVACGSCLFVAGSTASRLMEVLARYTLLQKYDSIQAGKGPMIRADISEEDRETSCARALKAIDMAESEELTIKAEVSSQELAEVVAGSYRYS